MYTQFQRIARSLAGAFIIGCIAAFITFSTDAEMYSSDDIKDAEVVTTVTNPTNLKANEIVFRVKKLVIGGWNDVVNPYTTVRLKPAKVRDYSAGISFQTGSNQMQLDGSEVATKAKPYPADKAVQPSTILLKHGLAFYIFWNRLNVLPLYRRKLRTIFERCRGPALDQGLVPVIGQLSNEVNIRRSHYKHIKYYLLC